MKIRRIYWSSDPKDNDMSKDRIELNMSYNEYKKLRNLIEDTALLWDAPNFIRKEASNFRNCWNHKEELQCIFLDLNKKEKCF